jgi:hypothetical protein
VKLQNRFKIVQCWWPAGLTHNPFFLTFNSPKGGPTFISVLLPENLHAYFELSAQAWILYKVPQWNARYPNSFPERIKL